MNLLRRGAAPLLALVLPLVAACDREPRGEPSPHIRSVLEGADSTAVLRLPDGDTLHLSAPVVAFYRARGFRQAWTDYDEILDGGWALLEAMGRASEDGLAPETYRQPLAARMVAQVEEDSLEEAREPAHMATVDLVLSEVFGRYANHLAGGIVDPRSGGLDWRIPTDTVNVGGLLRRLASEEPPADLVAELRPEAPEYRRTMAALARYREIADGGGWPDVPEDTPDEVGERGPGVAALRQRLIAEGNSAEASLARVPDDGGADRVDEELKAALEHFQRRHGIVPDGVLGPATLAELNTPVEDRLGQLGLNLDRWRWLPRDLGELYLLVNVAGFEMELVEDDSVLLAMNVVVGQQGWETPLFRDTMEHIVVNPYWNVPPGIEAEEVLPAIRRDPDYLARNRMEVLRGDRVVDPGSVDWASLEGGSSPYRFRQRPGPQNALGKVKFLFPNSHDIYLHDTPADRLFAESSRAFSHGCIRLEKPLELARVLFERVTDASPDRLDELLARDSEQWVQVTRPVPVYIVYFTAWAAADGTVRFYPDVYERDRRLREEATRVLQPVARASGAESAASADGR